MKIFKYIFAGFAAMTAYKYSIVESLEHFEPEDFRGEWVFLAAGLLQKLDHFRSLLGRKVWPSPAHGSMLRYEGSGQHTFGRAIDVIIEEGTNATWAFECAKKAGFTGIGIYPNSGGIKRRLRMHLDIRPDRTPENPATWGFMGGRYVSIFTAIREANAFT